MEKHLQPKLRFPEFNGDWEMVKLKQVFQRVTSKNRDNSNKDVLTISGKKGLINQFEYYNNQYASKDLSNYYLIEKGDFAYNKSYSNGYPFGAIKSLDKYDSGVLSPLYICFRSSNVVNNFYTQYFESTYFNHELYKICIEGARNHGLLNVAIEDFFNSIIPFTKLLEQQKIADYLTTINSKIDLLEEKKEQLSLYKKVIMQKLFSQEIRFNDDNGNEFPNWEEKRLADLGKFGSGTGFSESEQGGKSGIPFIKVSDMNLLGNEIYITSANNYVSELQVKKNKYKVINKPSIIFAKVGAAIFLERKRIANNFLIDNNMMAFTPFGNILFYYYLFLNIRLCKFSQTGALPSYNSSDISTIKVKVPSLPEQQKIANYLSVIDKSTEKVNEQITQTKSFKKAMLQQMFI